MLAEFARDGLSTHAKAEVVMLWDLLIGLVVGAITKLIMPGTDPGRIVVTMLIGLAGAFIATSLGRALGWYLPGQQAGFIASIFGALLLLWRYRLFVTRRVRSP
ncbi:MAG TPA: GlsB/YeaQ/YmgE family stress response membrane protein [Gemmatimonadaceae bacterium]|nr:GlsB/YeaQ/YmgE family stress response membrane protein [Gemmatimonadaceae bacterium]